VRAAPTTPSSAATRRVDAAGRAIARRGGSGDRPAAARARRRALLGRGRAAAAYGPYRAARWPRTSPTSPPPSPPTTTARRRCDGSRPSMRGARVGAMAALRARATAQLSEALARLGPGRRAAEQRLDDGAPLRVALEVHDGDCASTSPARRRCTRATSTPLPPSCAASCSTCCGCSSPSRCRSTRAVRARRPRLPRACSTRRPRRPATGAGGGGRQRRDQPASRRHLLAALGLVACSQDDEQRALRQRGFRLLRDGVRRLRPGLASRAQVRCTAT